MPVAKKISQPNNILIMYMHFARLFSDKLFPKLLQSLIVQVFLYQTYQIHRRTKFVLMLQYLLIPAATVFFISHKLLFISNFEFPIPKYFNNNS